MSSPVVLADRNFNSSIVVMNCFVLIQGTRFGTKAELDASEVMILMNKHFGTINLKCRALDWVASCAALATDVVYQVTGGLVSSRTFVAGLLVLCPCFAYRPANILYHSQPRCT
jgi:hypothetical protein